MVRFGYCGHNLWQASLFFLVFIFSILDLKTASVAATRAKGNIDIELVNLEIIF